MHVALHHNALPHQLQHPGNIEQGHIFADVDREGNGTQILALRPAKRLRGRDVYRIIGLDMSTGKITSHVFDATRNITMLGSIAEMSVDFPSIAPVINEDDPAIAERDAANEGMDSFTAAASASADDIDILED